MLQLALKLQKRRTYSTISDMLLFTNSQLSHFTNQAHGDRRGLKLMNFNKEFILYICFVINTELKGFLMKLDIYINFLGTRIPNAKAIALYKIDMTHLVKITIGLRYQKDP